MTALVANRDALANAIERTGVLPSNGNDQQDWFLARDLADALLASGAVVDASTLEASADDEPVAERLWDVLDEHGHNGIECRVNSPMDYTVRALLRALAAALAERGEQS